MRQLFGVKIDAVFAIMQIITLFLKVSTLVNWGYGAVFLPSVFFLIYVTIRDEDSWMIYIDIDDEGGDYEEEID